ncbi:hypothetical protein niasHS_007667 [Heterodera schachtii]|uniref:DB domain-containing protein n=1 Tax=Heterodera schachtii TaxID=97005 RepID=A0ABD2JPC9_HETSC
MLNQQNKEVKVAMVLFSLIHLFAAAFDSPQCNLGLKLFSIEGGKFFLPFPAVCAPIAPFQCVESCEWINSEENGGGCEHSSHFTAFRGRRTFLSGIVLSEQSILLQCCASLATSVELGDEKETKCHWSEEIETVVDRPNMRFERVLGKTEYYRNLGAVRNGRSAIKLRAEVCRYTSERTFCERNKMSGDDFNKYSLLLMRLQRTKEFMQMRSNVLEQKEFKSMLNEDGFSPSPFSNSAGGGEEKEIESNQSELVNSRKESGRAIFKNRTNPIGALLREAKTKRINKKDEQILLNGEVADDALKGPKLGAKFVEGFGRRFWGEREEIIANAASPPQIPSGNSSSFPIVSAKTTQIHTDSNFRTTKMPTTLAKTTPFFIDPRSNERIIFNDPRRQMKKHNSSREMGKSDAKTSEKEDKREGGEGEQSTKKMNQTEPIQSTHNHEATIGPQHLAIRRIRYPQMMEQRTALFRPSAASPMGRPKGPKRRLWPVLATNSTKELIPANIDQKWNNGKENWRGAYQIRSGNVGKNWQNLRQTNYSLLDTKLIRQQKQNPIAIRALSPRSQNIPPTIRHELRIKKLSRKANSNGIQKNSAVAKQQLTAEESREKQLFSSIGSASGAGGSFASAEPLEEAGQSFPTLSTILPQAFPQILTHPLEKAPQFKFLSLIDQPTDAAVHRQSLFGMESVGNGAEESTPKLGDRLMECCQQQGHGCRAICRRDVNKEKVKKVMVSGQCPPVTMTGVIQCFPRFFNISSVGKCCAQRTKIGENNANSLPEQTTAQTLPLQCLSLCAPNFHLTFAHLACVEHIEHILDCYRQLLEDNSLNNSAFLQQQKLITLPSSPFS